MRTTASKLPTDSHCRKPLCIRHITRQQQSGDYRFEVEWHTSAGVIKTIGWRWLRAHNRIVAPSCNGHHIFKLPATVRASIRRLFTEIMRDSKGVTIPPINVKKVRANSENLFQRQPYVDVISDYTLEELVEQSSPIGKQNILKRQPGAEESATCLIKGSQDGEAEEPCADS